MENLPENNWYRINLLPGTEKTAAFIVFLAEGTTLEHMHDFWESYFGSRDEEDTLYFEGVPELAEMAKRSFGMFVTHSREIFSDPTMYPYPIIVIDHPNRIVQSLVHIKSK